MSGMKVSQAVKAARGHWAQILPALGVKIAISLARSVAVKIVFASTIRKDAEHGSAISAEPGMV